MRNAFKASIFHEKERVPKQVSFTRKGREKCSVIHAQLELKKTKKILFKWVLRLEKTSFPNHVLCVK